MIWLYRLDENSNANTGAQTPIVKSEDGTGNNRQKNAPICGGFAATAF